MWTCGKVRTNGDSKLPVTNQVAKFFRPGVLSGGIMCGQNTGPWLQSHFPYDGLWGIVKYENVFFLSNLYVSPTEQLHLRVFFESAVTPCD